MPLVNIELARGKAVEYRQAIAGEVYRAMRETIQVPENDLFVILSEHDPENLIYDRQYLGMQRSDDLVIVRITLLRGRTGAAKRALFRRIAERLEQSPGIRGDDLLVALVENGVEDWSFGKGEAQYAR